MKRFKITIYHERGEVPIGWGTLILPTDGSHRLASQICQAANSWCCGGELEQCRLSVTEDKGEVMDRVREALKEIQE